jgi:hypothetical protein
MLASATIRTAEQVHISRQAAEERMEHERAAAKARKEKMLRLGEEAKLQVSSDGLRPQTSCQKHFGFCCQKSLWKQCHIRCLQDILAWCIVISLV